MFVCPDCLANMKQWASPVFETPGTIHRRYYCPKCSSEGTPKITYHSTEVLKIPGAKPCGETSTT